MDSGRFDKQQERLLRESIAQLQEREAVLSYYQLQGLLFAIACSPEPVKSSEWFDLLWLDDEPQFDTEDQARQFYKQVVTLAEHIDHMIQQHHFLPFSADYSDLWQQELAQWCEGLLFGHYYLEELWAVALDDLNDEELGDEVDTCLNIASTFADLIEAKQLSFGEGLELTGEHLPEAYEMFGKALSHYAIVGSIWADDTQNLDAEQLFLALESVPASQSCPCGSGQVFAKCCLH